VNTWPGHALTDEILLQRAKIAEHRYDYDEAITFYQKILTEHYFGINADNALFKMADLYEFKLKDYEKAQELYKQLMVDFPGSLFVVEARKRYRNLRGDAPNQEIREILPDSKENN
jgi:tetratricopeptide (TPR) repeat protein